MIKILNLTLVTGAIAALLAINPAIAADGAALYKTKSCVACHGPAGNKPLMPTYPKIAGQNMEYSVQQMKDIKSGARNNGMTASMKVIMHLVSDEEIDAIAKYLSEQ